MVEDELTRLGFRAAGRFSGGFFELHSELRGRQGVYVWVQAGAPLRVGVACGPDGFRSRYRLYNSWLDGRFKPHDAVEQQKRALFLTRLADGCAVWTIDTPHKPAALHLERTLRAGWGARLDLDLMASGSWAKAELKSWRDTRAALPTIAEAAALSRPRRPSKSRMAAVVLSAAHARLERMLMSLDLKPWTLARGGISYKLGPRTFCRIDAKRDHLCVRR